jgi:phage gp29-like protein
MKDVARQLGAPDPSRVPQNDPGHQPPRDPLTGVAKGEKSGVRVVYRDLPNISSISGVLSTIQNSWTVPQVLGSHMLGIFERSGQLWDSILGDDRVQATLGSRISGLFGREVRFSGPLKGSPAYGSDAAKECQQSWEDCWPQFAASATMSEMQAYTIGMGFEPAQLVWDDSLPIWTPQARPWHPRFVYYHWPFRKYIALSQDGAIPIIPGNGKWLLHAPYGEYRGWIRGAIRAVAEPWLIRHFAIRDWARYSEIHGIPIRVGGVPAASSEPDRDQFQAALATLGNESTIMLPMGVDGEHSDFTLSLVEAKDHAWESFPGLRDHCDMAIVLALLFQNLTTEIKGGSFAAATAHMDIRQGGIEQDNQAWRLTIHNQVARAFAYLNFGDADLAPWTDWDVSPREEYTHNAEQFSKVGTAVEVLRRGGVQFKDEGALRKWIGERFGLKDLPEIEFKEPVGPGAGGASSGGVGAFKGFGK